MKHTSTRVTRPNPKVRRSIFSSFRHVKVSLKRTTLYFTPNTLLSGASPKKSKDSESKKKKKPTSTNVDGDGSTETDATFSSKYNANVEDDVQNNPTNVHSSSQPPTPTEVVLSLRQEPYKSIMHAHFRLFGPNRFTGGSNIEKVVGERILDRILSGYYHRDVGNTKTTVVTLYKLNRAGDDVEEIFHSVALRSESCY
jgi:hypothetical protein